VVVALVPEIIDDSSITLFIVKDFCLFFVSLFHEKCAVMPWNSVLSEFKPFAYI
jgi:hypothetical protein